jgi:putative SOS response-associated peptidase YedK
MCNEYARQIALARLREELAKAEQPSFEWHDSRIPNDLGPKPSLKIRDLGLVVRLRGDRLVGQMLPWAWYDRTGKPVFNFVTEGRDFSGSDRVLTLATGFYEHGDPKKPGVKLKDRYFFTMRDRPWHWIAGIVKEDSFTMLTRQPGPDVAPYHKRSIVPLAPAAGLDWLTLRRPQDEVLSAPPAGTLDVRIIRRDGVALGEDPGKPPLGAGGESSLNL